MVSWSFVRFWDYRVTGNGNPIITRDGVLSATFSQLFRYGRVVPVARILIVCLPFAGHVGALSAVTGELVRRGHDVLAYTGSKYARRFTAAGAGWLPFHRVPDFDDADLAATFPAIGSGKGLRSDAANGRDVLFGTGAAQAADIVDAARERPFDLLVTDQTAFGGALAGESLGAPWVTVSVSPLTLSSRDLPALGLPLSPAKGTPGRIRDAVLAPVARFVYRHLSDPLLNRMRAGAGLGPAEPGRLLDAVHSPHLVLAQGVPGLDYPRSDLPAHVHYVGRLAGDGQAPAAVGDLPDWWPDVQRARDAGRRVVHVSQGTLDTDPADLLRPTLAGLAGEPVLVVATTGGAPAATLEPLPANARAAPFLPHDRLLPGTDVMITNGGWGGVLAAVQSGVPLIVAPGNLDKPEVARRVAASGAGLNLRRRSPGPQRLRRAVREVLSRPQMRDRAAELGARITAAGGVPRAGDLIEALLR
jgi:UDP:flavonoid glycosyltransferase YjiC (YdhE family)